MKTAIVYTSTHHGSTRKPAEAIAAAVELFEEAVTVL